MVKRENLMVIAGIVWLIAGINVLRLGVLALGNFPVLAAAGLGLGATFIFGAFHAMFSKMVRKHVARISALPEERYGFWRFFDAKGYLIMAFMMTFGFGLRAAGLVPDWFVAFFYTGLGFALALAGVGFLAHRKYGADWTFHKSHVVQNVAEQA